MANAVKFGAEGGWVGVDLTVESDEARIRVADRGPGVPEAERRRIFEPFYRGRQARDSQTPGSGLGLGLAAQVAENHDGGIEVSDGDSGGAVFTVILPLLEDVPQ